MPAKLETKLTFNTGGKAVRKSRDGKSYLVTNGVLITEGVHTGTSGPIFYSQEFIKKVAPKGNDRPVVRDHPVNDNGEYITANEDGVVESSGFGDLKNVTGDSKRMKAQLWFDEEKTKKLDKKVYNALKKGKPLEVSTGFMLITDDKAGEWNGQKYKASAVDADFDHLAIVTSGKGACDNGKGCGANITVNCTPITNNDTSFSRIASGISEYLYKTFGYNHYVREVYPKFFIYRDGNGDLFKRTYTVNDDGEISIGKDTPVKVKFVQEYRTADSGKFVGNSSQEVPVEKLKKHIDTLVANEASGFTEEDRDFLTKKGEAWVEARVKTLTGNTQAKEEPKKKEPPAAVVEKKDEPQTLEELVANTKGPLGRELQRLVKQTESRKEKLISAITANKSCKLNPEWLKEQDVEALEEIAQLAGVKTKQPAYNYAGADAGDDDDLVNNEADEEEEPLEAKRPVFNKK